MQPPSKQLRPIEDFLPLLPKDVAALLVGGQAVNFWARYYSDWCADYYPFVSKDADVIGDLALLEKIAAICRIRPTIYPTRTSNVVGIITKENTQGEPLIIEVLRGIYGINLAELDKGQYEFELDGTPIRLPNPIAMLKAKIANAADLPQTNRQDERHVRIMAAIMPGYLADLRKAVLGGHLTERDMIKLLERLLEAITSERAVRVLTKLKIAPQALFDGLEHPDMPKLQAFLTIRLPQLLAHPAQ